MSLTLPDISEFQGVVDWPNFGSQVAIVRLCYGDLHVDKQADTNIDGARSKCVACGWYCYLVAGRDPVVQANMFCRILQAHGGLKPNEFVVVDDEESTGANEAQRITAFLDRCDAALNEKAAQDWWYSGLNFSIAHNLAAARGHRWIAAYNASEPTTAHDLWQFTSSGSMAGVAGHVDLSIYHGTIEDFMSLIGGATNDVLTDGLKVGLSHIAIKAMLNQRPTSKSLFDFVNTLNPDGSNYGDLVQQFDNLSDNPDVVHLQPENLLAALNAVQTRLDNVIAGIYDDSALKLALAASDAKAQQALDELAAIKAAIK
jgi:GH25 family lysozyme M1 (1,4-beta-N-acetylmuramidase)